MNPEELGIDPDANGAAELLGDIQAFITRYVALPSKHEPLAIALWIMLTYVFERFDHCPYLAVTSPEKRSGKTTLLEALELVVARPWRIASPSEAVFFRRIERDGPTVLLDEVDCIFGGRQSENHEALRAALNAGNRAGTKVSRCVGKGMALKDFSVFCPKVLAGIGNLPDTVGDRSIHVRMRRRTSGEKVARFRRKRVELEATPLRERLGSWAQAFVADGLTVDPPVLEEIHDRAADNWEPLLAIANRAGGGWIEKAEDAARALEGAQEDGASVGVRLLSDLRGVWPDGEEFVATAMLLDRLKTLEEAPWAEWNKGRGLTGRALADLLKPFDVHPRPDSTGKIRGYYREHLADPWARYVVVSRNGGETVKPSESRVNGGAGSDTLTVHPPSGERTKARGDLEALGVRVWIGEDGELRTDPPPVALDDREWELLNQAMAEHRAAADT